MQGQGADFADAIEPGEARAAGDHVVLRVNLEPQAALGSDRRAVLGLDEVLRLEAHPGGRNGRHQRFAIGVSEPLPRGVRMVAQVPLATSFQALP